jgi:plastocyanin
MPVHPLGFPSRALKPRWQLVLAVTAAGAALAGCGRGTATPAGAQPAPVSIPPSAMPMAMPSGGTAATAPTAAPVATSAVTIDNFAFAPKAVTVKVGSTVTWTNRDEEPHTVRAEDGSFKSGTLAGNNTTFSHMFTAPGTFTYHCSIHPYMTGTVEVTR